MLSQDLLHCSLIWESIVNAVREREAASKVPCLIADGSHGEAVRVPQPLAVQQALKVAEQFCLCFAQQLPKQQQQQLKQQWKPKPRQCLYQQTRPHLVAVLVPRSIEYVIAVLAALAAGAAFLPLDPTWPLTRLQQVLAAALPDVLVTCRQTAEVAAAVSASLPATAASCQLIMLDKSGQVTVLKSQQQQHRQQQQQQQHGLPPELLGKQPPDRLPAGGGGGHGRDSTPGENPHDSSNAGADGGDDDDQQQQQQGVLPSPALLPWFYMLFTSGSTGSPLGVLGTEQGFLNRYRWMQQAQQQEQQQQQGQLPPVPAPVCPGDVVCFSTAVSFVDHIWELLAPLLAGADMLIVLDDSSSSGGAHDDGECDGDGGRNGASNHPQGGVAQGPQPPPPQEPQQCGSSNQPLPQQLLPSKLHPATWQSGMRRFPAAGAAQARPTVAPQQHQQHQHQQQQQHPQMAPLRPVPRVLQPTALVQLLVKHRVTHLVAVPSILQLWLLALLSHKQELNLKQLVSSGEMLSADLAGQLLDVLPAGCVLLNLYGSTEVSADVTCCVITRQLLHHSGRWMPAGLPISNMMVAVLPMDVDLEDQQTDPADIATDAAATSMAGAVQGSGAVGAAAPAAPAAPAALAMAAGLQSAAAAAAASADIGVLTALPQPLGSEGEVWVAGTGVAAGYLHSSNRQTEPDPAGSAAAAAAATVAAALPFRELQLVGSVQDRQQLRAHAAADSTSCHLEADELAARTPDLTGLSVAAGQGLDVTSLTSRPQRWFRTGDVGKLNSEGVLQLLGRRSQLVKIRGVRVDLLEVEAVLSQHPLVQQAAAATWPHPQRMHDAVLSAYIVLQPPYCCSGSNDGSRGKAAAAADMSWQQKLHAHAAAHLVPAACPARYQQLADLPRTSAGKMLRSKLPPPPPSPPWPLVIQEHISSSSSIQVEEVAGKQHGQPCIAQGVQHPNMFPQEQQQQAQQDQQQQGVLPANSGPMSGSTILSAVSVHLAPHPAADLAAAAQGSQAGGHAASAVSQHSEVAVMRAMLGALPAPPAAVRLLEPIEDFFTVGGGDSLAAAAVAAQLGIDVRLVFAYPTARSLAAFLQSSNSGSHGWQAPSVALNSARSAAVAEGHQQQHDEVQLIGPQAKRRKLLVPAVQTAAAASQSAESLNDSQAGSHLAVYLAAATAVVHIAASSRCQVWNISSSVPAVCAGDAANVAPMGSIVEDCRSFESVHEQLSQQQQQHQEGTSHSLGECAVEVAWRQPLGRCVDAAPLVLAYFGATGGSKHQQQQHEEEQQQHEEEQLQQQQQGQGLGFKSSTVHVLAVVAFACSHDGRVACVGVASGHNYWVTHLPGHTDAGLYCSPCGTWLAVPSSDNNLYCLSVASGAIHGCTACEGAVRAAPAADPWCGLCWLVTHSKELLVIELPNTISVKFRVDLPAAGSACVAFARAAHLAIIALLDGSVLAFQVNTSCLQQQQQQQQLGDEAPLLCSQLWRFSCSVPVFSSPVAVESQAAAGQPTPAITAAAAVKGMTAETACDGSRHGSSVLVCVAVDGRMYGLELMSGNIVWQLHPQDQQQQRKQQQTQQQKQQQQQPAGNVFADLLLVPPPCLPAGLRGTNSTVLQKPSPAAQASAAQTCAAVLPVLPVLPAPHEVVVATQTGWLYGVRSDDGRVVWARHISGSSIAAAPAATISLIAVSDVELLGRNEAAAAAAAAASHDMVLTTQHNDHTIVTCSSNGEVDVGILGVQPVTVAAAAAAHQVPCHQAMSHGEPAALTTVLAEVPAHRFQQAAAVCLPSEVFSSPIAVGDRVLLGCRDDHLYCLKLCKNKSV